MITKQGSKPLLVKVDPGADVNTVPLSKYKKFISHTLHEGRQFEAEDPTSNQTYLESSQ